MATMINAIDPSELKLTVGGHTVKGLHYPNYPIKRYNSKGTSYLEFQVMLGYDYSQPLIDKLKSMTEDLYISINLPPSGLDDNMLAEGGWYEYVLTEESSIVTFTFYKNNN